MIYFGFNVIFNCFRSIAYWGHFQGHLTHPQSIVGKIQTDEHLIFYRDFILGQESLLTPVQC